VTAPPTQLPARPPANGAFWRCFEGCRALGSRSAGPSRSEDSSRSNGARLVLYRGVTPAHRSGAARWVRTKAPAGAVRRAGSASRTLLSTSRAVRA